LPFFDSVTYYVVYKKHKLGIYGGIYVDGYTDAIDTAKKNFFDAVVLMFNFSQNM